MHVLLIYVISTDQVQSRLKLYLVWVKQLYSKIFMFCII